jgi:hypothetical protein
LILFLHFKIRNPNHQNVIWAKRHRTTKAKYNKLSEIKALAVFLPVAKPSGLRTKGPTDLARRFIHKNCRHSRRLDYLPDFRLRDLFR